MKNPLSINILFHSKNTEGEQIYHELYKILCRDPKAPFSDGLDIPIYFITDDNENIKTKIDENQADKIFILLLIDINMIGSESWKEYVDYVISISNTNPNIQIFPVKQHKYAFDFNNQLQYKQFICLEEDSILNVWDAFQTRLFDSIIRFLLSAQKEKIKIFISHSKKDANRLGEIRAEELKDYLRKETKLSSFFDVNDILDGLKFDEEINKNVAQSLLIILFTDTYSSREWCRREVIEAKKNKRPIIAVLMAEGYIDRLFPYMGNIPSISYNNDWRPIVNLLLKTALNQSYENLFLKDLISDKDTDYIPFPPEAYSLSILDKAKNKVLYPEPPLGSEELSVLKDICPTKAFFTPIQAQTQNLNFKSKKVAISISESDDLKMLGMGREVMNDLSTEIARHLLIANAILVYGGDLRLGGFTQLFKELSFQYGTYERAKKSHNYFINYFSWPISTKIKQNDIVEFIHSRIELKIVEPAEECVNANINLNEFLPPISTENLYLWGKSLTKMRKEMESAISARILIGGRCTGFKGSMAGLLEEFKQSIDMHHPIYLVGGFGGVTHLLCEIIEKRQDPNIFFKLAFESKGYENLFNYYKEQGCPIDYSFLNNISLYILNNGLTLEENRILFTSTNIVTIISLILKGLNSKFKEDA